MSAPISAFFVVGSLTVGQLRVFTGQNRRSMYVMAKGKCSVAFASIGPKGVVGSVTFTGSLDDERGGTGLPLSEYSFMAKP